MYIHAYIHVYIYICMYTIMDILSGCSSVCFFKRCLLLHTLSYMLNSFISKITLKWPNKHDSQVQITESKPNMRRSSLSRAQLLTHLCMHVCVFTSQCIHLRGHFCIFFCFIQNIQMQNLASRDSVTYKYNQKRHDRQD